MSYRVRTLEGVVLLPPAGSYLAIGVGFVRCVTAPVVGVAAFEEVVLEVDNVRVTLKHCPAPALWRLYESLAYLSPAARDAGFDAPIPVEEGTGAPDDSEHQWDGMIRLLRRPRPRRDGSQAPPWFETGLLPRAMGVLSASGFPVRVYDFRVRPESSHDVPRFWAQGENRDYQERAVSAAYDAGRGVIVAPPRSGKTRILFELARRLNVPVLWVAPTTTIIDQTAEAALEYGWSESDVVVLRQGVDLEEVSGAYLWICTAAKALSLGEEAARSRAAVFCDELHHFTKGGAWGRKLHRLFPHVYHWYGASGTYFRSSGDDMALEAFLSGVVFEIESEELLRRGLLVPTRVAYVPVDGPPPARGQDVRKAGVVDHEYRNGLAAAAALHLAGEGRRTLVMVSQKSQGKRIAELCQEYGPPGKRGGWMYAEFLYRGRGGSPDVDRRFRRRLLQAFLDGTGPAILLGTSLLGEGVDLPDTNAMVWAGAVSAAVSYVQGLYRVATAQLGKTDSVVVDFADRHHPKLLDASLKRLETAHGDPVFQCSVLRAPSDLAAWVRRVA